MNPLEFLRDYSNRVGHFYSLSFRKFNKLKDYFDIEFEYKDLIREVYRLNKLFHIGEIKNKEILILNTEEACAFLNIAEDMIVHNMTNPIIIKGLVEEIVSRSKPYPPIFGRI